MSNGIELIVSLEKLSIEDRERRLLDFVKKGYVTQQPYMIVRSEIPGMDGWMEFQTWSDSLMIGSTDPVRISASAELCQRIADDLDMVMPTSRIYDLIWRQGHQLEPALQPADSRARLQSGLSPSMSDIQATYRYDRDVDGALNKLMYRDGLVAQGKLWILDARLRASSTKACNYGFASSAAPYVSASGIRMWQPQGTRHNIKHTDYSQVCRLVIKNAMLVRSNTSWEQLPIEHLNGDPALARHFSDQGMLPLLRQPGVTSGNIITSVPENIGATATPAAPVSPLLSPLPPLRVPFSMELRRGMPRSEATAKWQEWLRIPDDGFFGPVTQAFTKQFQSDQKLPVTGIVDKATWYTMAALRDDVFDDVGISALPGSKVTFMQARNFTAANRIAEKRIKHVVIHTMEAAEASTTAENVARWFAGANAPKASAHFCIDNDTIVQCVRLRDVAWHAPGANASGIGLEHAGYARQTREQWSDEYSERMLGLSAALAAALCVRFSIPVGFVDAEGLKRGEAGVTTHHEVSRAFKKSDHYDPGPNFPMDEYLAAVQRAVIDTGLLGLP